MKSIKILIVCFCTIVILTNNVYALGDIFQMGENWVGLGSSQANTTMDTEKLQNVSDSLYNLLLAVATAVALIVGAIMGIQFMTAGIDKRVQIKESFFPYVVSCVVVFGSLGIWKLTVMIMKQF